MKNGGAGDVQVTMNTPNLTELATALASLTTADRDAVLAETEAMVEHERGNTMFRVALATPVSSDGTPYKIHIIKTVREATGYGLVEAKNAVEGGVLPGTRTATAAHELANRINREWSKIVTGAIASTIVATAVSA